MTLETIRKRIKNDQETKDLVLSDSDLLKVNRYLDIRGQIIDGYQAVLKTEPYVEIIYVPTQEKKDLMQKIKLQNHLHFFDSDIYLQDASLDKFEVFNEERAKTLEIVHDFLNNYSKENYYKGLYIYGKYSTGKTYLLSAIAHELAKKDVNVLMVFMPDLVRSIKQGISSGDLEEKINLLKQADCLMLDDLGGENMSSWFRDEILLPIIQYRLSARLPVFITSNLTMESLAEYLSAGRNTELDYIKSVRLIQRIRDLTRYVELNDDQYKKR